jgi:catechol 2,3-dioxygenase-like lactoylglutathione lyase family enzyme
MRFHHMCVVVSDIEKAKRLWRDVMGFAVQLEATVPDGPGLGPDGIMERAPTTMCTPRQADDAFGVKDSQARVSLLANEEGAMIELMQTLHPAVRQAQPETVRYGYTGFTELGLAVDDIDYWWDRIRAAGYRTQAEYIWPCANIGRSFLFYDDDGNLIQMWQQNPATAAWT